MDRQSNQITAIYTRVDRGNGDIKSAIFRQKAVLIKYAWERGLTNIRFYSDCGFNGYDTARPDFSRLKTDIQHGKVSSLVLFSLPRLSRDYIIISEWIENLLPYYRVGLYTISESITPEQAIPLSLPIAALFGGEM